MTHQIDPHQLDHLLQGLAADRQLGESSAFANALKSRGSRASELVLDRIAGRVAFEAMLADDAQAPPPSPESKPSPDHRPALSLVRATADAEIVGGGSVVGNAVMPGGAVVVNGRATRESGDSVIST